MKPPVDAPASRQRPATTVPVASERAEELVGGAADVRVGVRLDAGAVGHFSGRPGRPPPVDTDPSASDEVGRYCPRPGKPPRDESDVEALGHGRGSGGCGVGLRAAATASSAAANASG